MALLKIGISWRSIGNIASLGIFVVILVRTEKCSRNVTISLAFSPFRGSPFSPGKWRCQLIETSRWIHLYLDGTTVEYTGKSWIHRRNYVRTVQCSWLVHCVASKWCSESLTEQPTDGCAFIQATLALYASWIASDVKNMLTGLVVDSGDGVTHVVPVADGYLIGKAIHGWLIDGYGHGDV